MLLHVTVHPLCVHAIKKLNIVIASDSEAIRYKNKIQTSTKTGYFASAQYDKRKIYIKKGSITC